MTATRMRLVCKIVGTLGLLDIARHTRVKRFVYNSTSEVYGNGNHHPVAEDIVVVGRDLARSASSAEMEPSGNLALPINLKLRTLELADIRVRRGRSTSGSYYVVGICTFETMFEYPLSALLVSTAVVA